MRDLKWIVLITMLFFACSGKETSDSGNPPEALQWLTYSGEDDKPTIVLVSGDEEYRSEEALPMLARVLNIHHGFNCIVLFAQDPDQPGVINPNYLHHIPGLEKLNEADLMIIFTRFRALPDEEMIHIDQFLKAGKPVIGIRTATHAFDFRDTTFESSYRHYGNFHNSEDVWNGGFGRYILGEQWISHHGRHRYQSTRGIPAPSMADHPILNGIEPGAIWGPSDVYEVRLPLPGDAQPIVMGQVIESTQPYDTADIYYGLKPTDRELATKKTIKNRKTGTEKVINPNAPMMPIAWIKGYQLPESKKGKVFTSTIGSSTDLVSEGTRRLLVNGVFWALDLEVPSQAKVDFVGDYNPTAFEFKDADYWTSRNLMVEALN
ncbi:MAG: ThuA domain-containing protein [Cyclobacteriaceae bacterium]